MAKRIFKYQILAAPAGAGISMPAEHKLLHVATQSGTCTLWAEVDENAPDVEIPCAVVCTGGEPPEGLNYVGTVFSGIFVFHVYVGRPA